MTISLYDVSVPQYLQILSGVSGFLEKGLAFCRENKIDPESLIETRLFADMHPLRFQVQQAIHHSQDAIEAVKTGQFTIGAPGGPNASYATLQALVGEARDVLQRVTPSEVNGRAGADVTFVAGERKMPFTAEGFILSFSLPNFFFHASTAYGILRSKGVPLGKRDFMGQLRIKR